MNIENLENELRKENIYSENEIMQILAFMFTLSEHLPSSIKEQRGYFNKFLIFKASHFLKKISEGKIEYVGVFEESCNLVLESLIPQFVDKKIDWNEFMELAKEKIIKEVSGIKVKILDVSKEALKETLALLNLDTGKKADLLEIFDQKIKFALQ